MTSEKFQLLCREKIVNYFNNKVDKTDDKQIYINDTYIVWYAKTLQNHKCLASTNISDGLYYEFTYNGDDNELYMDVYKKWENVCFTESELR